MKEIKLQGPRSRDKYFTTKVLSYTDEYFILHSEEWMKDGKFVCAAKLFDQNVIIVDDLFMELSDITKRFIILHEIGHSQPEIRALRGNKSDYEYFVERNKNARNGILSPEELAADNYALSKMNIEDKKELINGLYKVKHKLPLIAQKEMNLRIENIKKVLE